MSKSSDAPTVMPLPANSTVGILGDGQLGRMMALAAAPLGYQTHVFGSTPNSPAAQVTTHSTVADHTDQDALLAFAQSVDVVTLEFENLPVETIDFLAQHVPVRPNATALGIAQDRIKEKTFFQDLGLHVPEFAAIHSLADLQKAVETIGSDGVLKTTRFGYDGKGQVRVTAETDLAEAWAAMKGGPAIFESFVPFDREVSVVLARGVDGSTAVYEPSTNDHRHHILHTSTVPSGLPGYLSSAAQEMATKVAHGLDYVGVMAIELFVIGDDILLVNEMAPRPHNSGHWTMDACLHSQFSQAIRAVVGLPLGHTDRWTDVVMTNLIGDDVADLSAYQADPNTTLHLYGKAEARPGRKMGHINTTSPL